MTKSNKSNSPSFKTFQKSDQSPPPPSSPSVMNNIKDGMVMGFGAGLGRNIFDKVENIFTTSKKTEELNENKENNTRNYSNCLIRNYSNCFDEQNDFLICVKTNEMCKEKEETLRKCLKLN